MSKFIESFNCDRQGEPGRRSFLKWLAAGSVASVAALERLNASLYQSITELNQKYIQSESPDGIYW